ncbi:hypothetical protein [Rhodococcus jostii]|uniref:hypothetical protein n=1 Tax=Rhodococcus jostii TaxID=132919 RepID=UPI00362D22E6
MHDHGVPVGVLEMLFDHSELWKRRFRRRAVRSARAARGEEQQRQNQTQPDPPRAV